MDRMVDRRLSDDRDELGPLDEEMLEKLADVDEREATDTAIHVLKCGLRYEFVGSALKAIYNSVRKHGQSSRFNAGQLLILRSDVQQIKNAQRVSSFLVFVLIVIVAFVAFGRDTELANLFRHILEKWLSP